MTLGEETINTAVYTQIDSHQCHLVIDQLGHYALIGESVANGTATKTLRLAVFAPPANQTLEYYLRCYVLEDTTAALDASLFLLTLAPVANYISSVALASFGRASQRSRLQLNTRHYRFSCYHSI